LELSLPRLAGGPKNKASSWREMKLLGSQIEDQAAIHRL